MYEHRDTILAGEAKQGGQRYVVDGMIPAGKVCLLVGDSSIGKTPLMYQLAIAVSMGISFLQYSTSQGLVVVVDYENGIYTDVPRMIRDTAQHMHLPREIPSSDRLRIWTPDRNPGVQRQQVLDEVCQYNPSLIIIDTLGAWWPDAEERNEVARTVLQACRLLCLGGTSIILLHHVRKISEHDVGLDDTQWKKWFTRVRGASSLINASNVRMGLDSTGTRYKGADLLLRGYIQSVGDIGPCYLARRFNDRGEPIGFDRVGGLILLSDHHRETYEGLPAVFRWTEARHALRRSDTATTGFLGRLRSLGMIEQRGQSYHKVDLG